MLRLACLVVSIVSSLSAITVSGTVYNADSTPARGTVTISWPTFTCSSTLVMAGSKTIKLSNGQLSVALCPLDYYTVTYRLEGAPQSTVAWLVPASPSTVTILDVQTVVPPPGGASPGSGLSAVNVGTSGTDFNASLAGSVLTINCPTASATNRGCLSTSNWSTFNNKLGSGSSAGGDLTGTYPNPTLASVVSASTAGDVINANAPTVQVPKITYDAKGRITSTSVDSRAYVAAATTFGGDVSGTYNAINVAKLNGVTLSGLSTGLLKITTGTGLPSTAVVGDVLALWTGTCDNTNFLRGDGVCGTPTGVGGDVLGPATHAASRVPIWNTTPNSKTLLEGYAAVSTATADTLALRNGSGDIAFNTLYSTTNFAQRTVLAPTTDIPGLEVNRGTDTSPTADIAKFNTFGGLPLSAIDKDGNFTGRSATTQAFSSNPANCVNAGEFATGVSASGAAEGCAVPSASGTALGLYNVKDSAYGALGNDSNDDTAEIQAAITACETSSYGGIVYFPPGVYRVSGALTMGNGSGNTESTRRPCMLEGAGGTGAGTSAVRTGASVIKWTGSAPGSTTYMMNFAGPFIGGGIKHLTFDVNSKSNLRGVRLMTVSHGYFESLSIINYPSLGMLITAGTTGSASLYGGCDSFFSNLKIVWPATGGSGLALEGNDISDGMDACSNTFYNTMLWNDNNTAGTYGLNLGFADNNRFFGLNIYSFPNNVNNSYGIKFTQGSVATAFPHENTFYSVSAHQGVGGTVGSGQPNIFYDYHLGDCWNNCDPYNVGGSVKPIVFSTDRTMKGVYSGGALYTSTNEENETFTIEHSSGGQNGAGNIFFKRTGVNIGRIKSHYFDGLGFYVQDGGGTGTLNERLRLRNNGTITPSSVTYSDLGGEPTGTIGYCSNCQVTSGADNTCTSGGIGALAIKVNGTWRCFATQN